ncbi:MAG: phosphoadenylyl-sulfate reductase [Hyphomicrobiales bacterium]
MDTQQIEKWNKELESKSPKEVIAFFLKHFGNKIAFASSLGAEDQVITEMMANCGEKGKVFTLDTGRVFPESYELLERTESRYKMKIEVYFPKAKKVQEMVNERGVNLFYQSVENRKLCCQVRKIEPLQRAFCSLDAWICGLRSEQSPTRTDMKLVEWDDNNKLIKINPLIHWTEKELWDYIHDNNVPYNKLHDQGFPSIGCQPCTRAIEKGEDVRAGRWWWENPDTKECGLHKK